jgi:broad specificity phosphatase PhoE
MEGKVYLIRYVEAVRDIEKDFSRVDPELTPLGKQQASDLADTSLHLNNIGLISPPLRRTIQTTLLASPKVRDKKYYEPDSGNGIRGDAELILDPEIQELSALPCDTCSERAVLEKEFPELELGLWRKEGIYGAEEEAVERRAERVRRELRERIRIQGVGGR